MAWRLALRVARREAMRNKGRSLLVAAMIALPVAGAGAADTLYRSAQVTPAEQNIRDMGQYDALVSSVGFPLVQTPDGSDSRPASGPGIDASKSSSGSPSPAAPLTTSQLQSLLPAGSEAVSSGGDIGVQSWVLKGHSRIWIELKEADLADPLAQGMYVQRGGSAPTADGEVAVSDSMLSQLGAHVGDTIDVQAAPTSSGATPVGSGAPDGTVDKKMRITGVYDDPSSLSSEIVIARPGAFDSVPGASSDFPSMVKVPGGVGWSLVQTLNAHGFSVQSKQVMANPPPASAVPYYKLYPAINYGTDTASTVKIAVAAISVSMILLEVVLLAGPAFAVSARRRRRDFGLLGASGADSRRLRHIVLADGVVLGLVGGVLGVVVALGASAAFYPFLADFSGSEPGGFRIMPLELLAAAFVGVLTGLIAALAPAVATSRQDVLVALTGRRGQVRTPWRLPVTGAVGIGLGILLISYGAFSSTVNVLPIVVGIAIGELGVVALTPMLVAWSGHLARFLPLSGRLALRDGARNRGRTAPAVAAIMAAVAGATAVAMYLSTSDARDRAGYTTDLHAGEVGINLEGETGLDPAQVLAKIGAALPTAQSAAVSGVDFGGTAPLPQLVRTSANSCPPLVTAGQAPSSVDPRCVNSGVNGGGMFFPSTVSSGDATLVTMITGTDDPAADAVLKAGGAVVFDPLDLTTPAPNATVTIAAKPAGCPPDGETFPDEPANCRTRQEIVLPAVLVSAPMNTARAIVGPDALDKLGVKFTLQSALFTTRQTPTAADEQKANDAAAALGINSPVYVERGYQGHAFIGLIVLAAVAAIVTLGAAAVATGLAITDAQADLETLAAIGARPRARRTLAGAQAAVTAGLGAVLGAAFGMIPAIGLIEAQTHSFANAVAIGANQVAGLSSGPFVAGKAYLTVPWLFLGLTIVALPTIAALGASVFTRSRITTRQRRA